MPREKDDLIGMLDLVIIMAKRRWLIVFLTLISAVITAAASLVMSPVYLAETKILPPQANSSMAAQLMGQLGAASALAGNMVSGKYSNDLYIDVMKSRNVLDRIVARFGLKKLYGVQLDEEARNILESKIIAKSNVKSGIITVGIEDKDPRLAASIANAIIDELKMMNKALSFTEASQRRLFFEDQLKDAKNGLSRAEESMMAFQEKSGAVNIDAQSNAVILGVSSLRADISAKEVQIKVMKTYSTEQNPDILRAKEELKGLREQLSRLESKNNGGDVIVPTGNIPQASTEYVRRMRDLKFSETLYELLFSQYQAAKLDEARDAALIQVIEKAVPPEKRSKPRRSLMVFMATLSGFFISFVIACFLEYGESLSKNPEKKQKLALLKKHLKLY